MAMEVDEDEDNTQQPKAVADYGIEIEFDSLEDEDREVRTALHVRITAHWRL
jgi:structural maintenance of chromosome 1